MNENRQDEWVKRAHQVLPAGSFGNFDSNIIIRSGKGAYVWDENGKKYIDYLISSGPMLLGHGHPEVLDAVRQQLDKGLTFFANNARAIELAEQICADVKCAEQIRYVTSGGEADMYCMRLARAYTGRDKILKFEGGYHGMSAEAQMSLAPKQLANYPMAVPDSAGILDAVRDNMVIAPFNDFELLQSLLAEQGEEIAAIIVEPLQRIIPPIAGFLQMLRAECDKYKILLIFDEVVTGYRLAYGGAQEAYGVAPDLCALGKIIGGGFPLAAIAGRKDIMKHFDRAQIGDEGFLMQLGTLSGNPVAAVAGMKTMEILRRDGSYQRIADCGNALMDSFRENLDKASVPYQIVGEPCLFDIVFTDNKVQNYRDILGANRQLSTRFNQLLRAQGIFKSPNKTYPHLALSDDDLQITFDAIAYASQNLMGSGNA